MKKLNAEVARRNIQLLKEMESSTNIGLSMRSELYLQALEIALPVLEQQERAEPAYYLNQIDYGEDFELRAYFRELDAMKSKGDFGGVVIPVYTAAPAPVVPDEMEPTVEAIKRVLPTANPDEYAACIGADMWNACRAAMLTSKEAK